MELAASLSADFGRTVRSEDVEKGKEWCAEHNLKPEQMAEHAAQTPQVSGGETAEPKTDSVPAVNPPPSTEQTATKPDT